MVSTPQLPGCTVLGNSTGTCCAAFPTTFNTTEGSITCQTTPNRVSLLRDCLTPLTNGDKNRLACNRAPSRHAKPAVLALIVAAGWVAIAVLSV